MRSKEVVELLSQVKLFRGLKPAQIAKVARVTDVREARAGEIIVREGTFRSGSGPAFFVIAEGKADVTVRRKVVATLKPGDTFGEMSLLDGGPRSATVTTTTDVRTLALTPWAFISLVERSPSIAKKLLIELSKRLRSLEKSLQH